ncbi:tetratricopeptide repeat protein [Solilutibacter silvestris]|uniref:Tfp pilus assembly protein PilF n=1 Tax=Solilutibacter silvestris TaxID=1645665 RepID=A0A2K1PYM4_9GAMM|nr:tetratricopeptide repeat protein [Lysobacter silvestris]PNS07880.1 Tfp pilus assembly protein PilF [Lysobacter silvestris]
MRWREGALFVATIALALLVGCDRLTFVKPNMKKSKFEDVRSVPDVRDSASDRQRMAASDGLQLAGNRLQGGDLDGAEKSARHVLESDRGNTTAMTILALVEQRRGHVADAGTWFKRAAEQGNSGPAEWGNYGTWLCEANQPAESLQWLDRSLAYPDAIDLAGMRANAGKCALRAGQTERAERDLRAALDLAPANAVALDGMAQLMFVRGRMLEARAFNERRLAAAPATAETLARAAEIETHLGDQVAASRYRQRMAQEFPNVTPNAKGH